MTLPGPGNGADANAAEALPVQTAAATPDELSRLRELLLGHELRALDATRERVADIELQQSSLPDRLPAALEAVGDSPRVAQALAGPVAQALGAAVRENRQTVIDILFPVIGPLIRKSIAEALRNLVSDLNGAIESGFSPRTLKWRIEAWRAGVPYAQIVLKHRLAYRIEHVFLIARDSGLILLHESAPDLPPFDADAIAGMLTAIGDFVGDSVGQSGDSALDAAQVGEYLVWVVHGPRANLAAFLRGVPPATLRSLLEQRLEEIHESSDSAALDQGRRPDASVIDAWRERLQPRLLGREIGAVETAKAKSAPSRWPLLLMLLAALIALLVFSARRERWDAQIAALRARLQTQPGFVLTGIDAHPWHRLTVRGLLDPDAEPLSAVLDDAHLGGVHAKLVVTGYVSSDTVVVARRAQRLLAPPASVRITAGDGVLKLDGSAPEAWIAAAREHAAWIAGVSRVDMQVAAQADPVAAARAELANLVRTLANLQVSFSDAATPTADSDGVIEQIARAAQRAADLATAAHAKIVLTCIGANDEVGTDAINQQVREARAQWLAEALAARGVAAPLAVGGDADSHRRSAYLRLSSATPPP